MALRLAVVFLAALFFACGGSGGGSTPAAPQPQWGRGRADNFNSGVSPTGVTNLGLAHISSNLGGGPILSTPAIGNSGNVFVTTRDGGVFALDENLNLLWNYPYVQEATTPPPTVMPTSLGTSRSSVAVDGFDNVFFATDGGVDDAGPHGYVVSLDSSGQFLWQTDVKSPVIGSPLLIIDTVANDVQALFVTTSDGRVVALGGQDGQIRWQVLSGGEAKGSLAFDGLTLYASASFPATSEGFLYSLTSRGAPTFPRASLGALSADFSSSPSLFGLLLAQTGLTANGGGRVRGFTTAGTLPIWDAIFPAPIHGAATQFTRFLEQRVTDTTGAVSENQVGVTDFFVVDATGAGWLVNPQQGSLGTRCEGGPDDLQPCRTDDDCEKVPITVTPPVKVTCEPPLACNSESSNAGIVCRIDTTSTDCPPIIPPTNPDDKPVLCEPITKCQGGTNAGLSCHRNDNCPDGTCNLSLFTVGANVEAAPVTTAAGTILVVTAPAPGTGTGVLYAIEPPNTNVPQLMCFTTADPFCRFAFSDTLGAIRSSPSIALNGNIYFGDDAGVLYAITGN